MAARTVQKAAIPITNPNAIKPPETNGVAKEERHRRTMSVPVQAPKQKKRDMKPGYCENCMDKFDDFDEVSIYPERSSGQS